jgi:hypothetical protein
MNSEQLQYSNKVNQEFAEAIYQEMASVRYGIDFCCKPDLIKWSIKKELLDFNDIQLNLCASSNDPAQPGDRNFIPGPCGQLDITYTTLGGIVNYVPCNAYFSTSATFAGEEESSTICYDKNAGYTVQELGTESLSIIESEEICDE